MDTDMTDTCMLSLSLVLSLLLSLSPDRRQYIATIQLPFHCSSSTSVSVYCSESQLSFSLQVEKTLSCPSGQLAAPNRLQNPGLLHLLFLSLHWMSLLLPQLLPCCIKKSVFYKNSSPTQSSASCLRFVLSPGPRQSLTRWHPKQQESFPGS